MADEGDNTAVKVTSIGIEGSLPTISPTSSNDPTGSLLGYNVNLGGHAVNLGISGVSGVSGVSGLTQATDGRRQAIVSAAPESIEASMTTMKPMLIGAKDIIKIFIDDSEIAEVTQEQVARVKQMHAKFAEGASFSFNYNVLLLVAAVLAACGLVSNSVATIIAAMLVSPLMGPVIALAYGTTINDWKLVMHALVVEVLSLVFCIVMGLAIGAITGLTALSDDWPTPEMANRGTRQNLYVGLPVAFFSGLGVAVSLLDDQASTLVGVAISASLLPPAVNAGLLWICYFFTADDIINEGEVAYSQHDYRVMGGISLELTLANIFLIWLSGMLMFRVKEVLPIQKKVFWSDLGVARKIYQRRAILKVSQENQETLISR